MRRADKAHGTAGTADSRIDFLGIGSAVRNQDIADTFARQAQGFTVRIADNRVFVEFRDIKDGKAIVNDFPVRFIRNDIDRMADFLGLPRQQGGQFFIGISRVDDARRVIRRIDDDGPCMRCNGLFQSVQRNLEVFRIRRQDDGFGIGIVDIPGRTAQ